MKTFNEILASIIANISAAIAARIDTRIGTVLRDAILAPIASAIADLYSFVNVVSLDQSVSTYTSSTALDAIAANYGLSRASGTAATGNVRFYVMRRPTRAISIPFGTKVYATSVTPSLTFTTLQSVQIEDINSGVFFQESNSNSPYYGYYYVAVDVICSTTGSNGNLAAGALSVTDLQTVEGVDNPLPTLNGTDALTDAQLQSLIVSTSRGNIGTVYGYQSMVDANFSFTDTAVIPYDDPQAVRGALSSAVDIIILSNSAQPVTESFPYSPVITPSRQPVQSVTAVTLNGTAVGYTVNQDTSSVYAGSEGARTTISVTGSHLATDIVQISYTYNPDVSSVQSFFDLPTNKVLGSNVMVKQATRVLVGIHADIYALAGYSLSTILPAAQANIVNLFNGLLLGGSVQKTDIINVIYSVPGVDYVDTGTLQLVPKVGTEWGTDEEEVTALKRQVVALATDNSGNPEIFLNEVAPWQ